MRDIARVDGAGLAKKAERAAVALTNFELSKGMALDR
jgi:hypothetical protein